MKILQNMPENKGKVLHVQNKYYKYNTRLLQITKLNGSP